MRSGVLLLAALLVVTGCGSPGSSSEPGSTRVGLYAPSGSGAGGNGGLLTGRLEAAGECLYVVTDGTVRYLPVFPTDSVETSDDALVYRGKAFEVGDEISLGGGVVPRDAVVSEEAEMPRCADTEVQYWVVGHDG